MTPGRLLAAAGVAALTVGALALGLALRDEKEPTSVTKPELVVPFSQGVQEGRSAPFLPKGRYWLQNHWLDVDARGRTAVHAYVGALAAKPCTGVVILYRFPLRDRHAWPRGRVRVSRFPGIGPIKAVSAVGMTVRLSSAEGDRGVLVAETGQITWTAPERRRQLSDRQCAEL